MLKFNNPLVLGKKAVFNPDVFTAVGNPEITAGGQEVFSGSKLITPEWQAQPFKFDVKSINKIPDNETPGLNLQRASADEMFDISDFGISADLNIENREEI